MLIKYSEFLHWQCLMILLRVVDLISSNIPPSSSASMLDRDSWWFLSISLLVPCQSFVFIQIWNHDFTRTTHQEKVYTTAFLPGTESIIRKDLFGFTKLFKSIMMHAKLPTVYTKKGIKITIKLNIFNVWTMESREKLRLVSVKCWRWNTQKIITIFTVAAGRVDPSSMKTSYACQGDTLDLSCPSGQMIKIMRANYGRFSVGICNEHGITDWSVNCMAPRSLRILQDR